MKNAEIIHGKNVKFKTSFWSDKQELVQGVVIPYQQRALGDGVDGAEPSRCLENFRKAAKALQARKSGIKTPVFPTDKWHYTDENADPAAFKGWVFQDSDLYKWIEAASYALERRYDADLDKEIDKAITLICRAAEDDGYIDTLYTINDPAARFTNLRDFHELYCFGHLAEAACAHYRATGKKELLNAATAFADLICRAFGAKGRPGYDGHPIAEEGLLKLHELTGNKAYLETARLMIDRRGTRPYYFDAEHGENTPPDIQKYVYNQAHLPVREQKEAVGHAVRAVYLYTAMAHLARLDGDEALFAACKALFDDITQRKMYITGGIGSTKNGEAFTYAYDLPNATAYAESCAAVGMIFFARRMMQADADSGYFDAAEKCLYNCVLAGMAQDGKSFFYTNPLEAEPKTLALDERRSHIKPERQKWFDCACCPPNIARLIEDLGSYCFTESEDTVFINLYESCVADCAAAEIEISSDYLKGGKVNVKIKPKKAFTLAFRIPGWCDHFKFSKENPFIKKGYAYFEIDGKTTLEAEFETRVKIMRCNPKVRENMGKAAITRGPFVYCLEEADNSAGLHMLRLAEHPKFEFDGENILANGYRESFESKALYSEYKQPVERLVRLKFIPYYKWANRGENEMTVYIRYR